VKGSSRRLRACLTIALAALLAGASSVSCSRCGERSDDSAPAARTDEPAVPAPASLLADVTMPTPNASWAKLQRNIGGAVGILPASAGGLIAAVAGLDPFVASEIDGAAPIYGVVAGDPANAGFVIAMKLLDLRKARTVLVDGETARFTGREDAGVTELVPKGQAAGAPLVVGLSANGYLLVARRSADLLELAPYATRTLPKQPLPADGAIVFDVPRAALATVMRPKLEHLWTSAKAFLLAEDDVMRRSHGGRAPDYGDPKAIVGVADAWVTNRIGVVGDLEKMRIAVDVLEDGVSIVSTMTPVAGAGPARKWTEAMKVGDAAPLAALPATTAAALLMRDGEEDRADQSRAMESAITSALGARLAEGDAKKLHDVLQDFTKARGEVVTTGLAWDEPQGVSLRAPVRDGEAASRAVRGAIDLAKVAPFKELFRVKDVTSSTEEVPGFGKTSIATIVRERARANEGDARSTRGGRDAGAPAAVDAGALRPVKGRKGDLGLAWVVSGDTLSMASGEMPVATLGAAARPDRKLSDEPAIARPLAALGADASAVLVLQPLRFDVARANLPAAPLVLALGRKGANATFRIDLANGLLRELARWQMGL
jgi:hypothetical protein